MQLAPLDATGTGSVRHVNLRKEGNEDQKVEAADIKVDMSTAADVLLSFHSTLRMMMYAKDGEPRYPQMDKIHWNGEIQGCRLTITLPGRKEPLLDLHCKKITAFVFQPWKNWKLTFGFSAQIHTSTGDADALHRILLEDVQIHIRRDGDLIDTAGLADARKAAKKLQKLSSDNGTTTTISLGDKTIRLGVLTDDDLRHFREAGRLAIAEPRRQPSDGENQVFETAFAVACQGYAAAWVEEHLAEIQKAFTDGWESASA